MTQRQNSPFRRLNLQIRHPLFANYDLFPNFVTVNIDVYSVSICLSFSLKCHGSTNEYVHWAAAIRESGSFFCSGKSFASDAEENRRRAVSYVSTWLACLPRDATHTHLPPKSGCKGIQRGAFRRGATTPSRNPVRGAKRQRAGT